jgi:tetratricopeptide (TPR) repeat protein
VLSAEVPSRFRLVRPLGEGGMGVVYEAIDCERNARVALKTLRHLTASSLVRFKREFRALQDLHHPNVVALGELVSEGGAWFYSMEFIEGADFLKYIRAESPWRPSDVFAVAGPAASEISTDMRRYVRFPHAPSDGHDGAPLFDEGRLRESLRQLASALLAVHEAGLVHRDVKPGNVIVTHEGRVVLVDFGLVADVTDERFTSAGPSYKMVGTPVYMAPEQALSAPVGPEADMYGFGVLLHEALTGALPFEGTKLQVLLDKQQHEPPAPRSLAPGIPADLDALCSALLRVDPKQRPTAKDILVALGADAAQGSLRTSHPPPMPQAPFVGRAAEIEELRRAFRETRKGAAVAMVVQGESGMGKSCLVRHFTERLAMEERDLVVVAGRCYERESIPYKAFDGVIDTLTRFLARLPNAEAARFLPTRAAPLVQVFPVLRRVEAIANLPRLTHQTFDPVETRARAFQALRELLTRLADRYPLVLVMDDLQWVDADSITQLAEVLRPPDAPNLLLIAMLRPRRPEGSTLATRRHALYDVAAALPGDVRSIFVGPMSDPEAVELAGALLERIAPNSPMSASAIAAEAEGHPLFIDTLVRHGALVGEMRERLRLEDALASRIEQLDEPSRVLMGLLAVAGAPIPQDVLARAASAESSDFTRRVSALRAAHLAQTTGRHGWDLIEPSHDRVRDAVLAKISASTRLAYHRRLALALETEGSGDAEALAIHWRGAGDSNRAATYARMAAEEAAQALAFDRAASLYRLVLASHDLPSGERRAVQEKLGEALANGGRGALAAKVFEEAAVGAKAADALDLQRRAAEQLLRSGHFDEGVVAIQNVLGSLGLALPVTPWRALAYVIFWGFLLRLRGLRFRERDSSQLAPRELATIDICWSVAFGLSMVDHIRAAAFQVRHLRLALDAGEPHRVARALALEIAFVSRAGGPTWRRTKGVMRSANDLAKKLGDGHAQSLCLAMRGLAHYYAGQFRESLELCDRAERSLPELPTGAAWEIDNVRLFILASLAQLGELKELARRRQPYLRDALDRGDLYSAVNIRVGFANFACLVDDDPVRAKEDVREAMDQWSKQGFHLEHFYELQSLANIDLYCGRPALAHARITKRWRPFTRSMLRTVQVVRVAAWSLRARTALSLAEVDPREQAQLSLAERGARHLIDERMAWAAALASLISAGVLNVRGGPREKVIAHLRDAEREFDAVGMALHAAATRCHLGGLLSGREGGALLRQADSWMSSQGVRNPAKLSALLAPGFAAPGSG